jgi:PKD repeat protein
MKAVWGKGMCYYLIILCLVLLMTPAVAGAEAPVVTGITPAINSSTLVIANIAGSNFISGATVMLTPRIVNPVHKGSITNGAGGALLSTPRGVFVAGNHAYVASSASNALEIVDVSNPANPVHKGSIINGAGGALLSAPRSVFVAGNYAYVASSGSNALEIVNIANPSTPVHAGSIANGAGGALLNIPYSVFVCGNYAYVASSGSNALEIIDISNPANPVHAGKIQDGNGGAVLKSPYSVYVSGNYAYVASFGSNYLEIVNVIDPAAPVHTGSFSYDTLVNPQSVYVSGNYAYVASSFGNSLEIVNVANPAAPVHSGSISNYFLNGAQSVYVSGNYAYVAGSGSNALEIVDVTNPANPVHNASISNGAEGALLNSPYSVYVAGNHAYVASSGSNALEVIDIGTITATGVNVVSPNQITCTFNVDGKAGGSYNVVVTNPDGGFGTLTRGFTINDVGSPVAAFSGTPISGISPLSVTFTDSSTNIPTSWSWSFGDGTFSTSQNPVHTFSRSGPYTISLTVSNAKGSNTLTRPDYIVVNGDAIGIFRNAAGDWKLDFNNTGVIDKAFHFGTSADKPLVGDWDGDGTTDVGLFRPSVGNWYLNYYEDSIVDRSFRFGTKGDMPIAGDWNGDGATDVGLFRPSTGDWILETTKTGVVYQRIHFGANGDKPLVGDWNGDGITDVGVFRPSTRQFIFNTVPVSRVTFGLSTDTPIIGDWNGDNRDDVGVFRPSTRQFIFNTVPVSRVTFGLSTDTPIMGDWNADGTTDIGVFRQSTGDWIFNYYKNSSTVNKRINFGKSGDSPVVGKWITVTTVQEPVADFSAGPRSGTVPLTVAFTDLSTSNSRLTYSWDFGDGGTSVSKNPIHTYPGVGSYTVTLMVSNTAGSDSEVKTDYITVDPAPVAPVANFTAEPRSGTAPHTVTFTDTSTGSITSRVWDYRNGTVDWTQFATSENPSFVFPAGTYDIRLSVTGPVGSSNWTEIAYITVNPAPVAPVAAFTNTTPRAGTAPLTVTFADQSTGSISSYAWDFDNDGANETTLQNPAPYQYTTAGTYTVKLTVTGPGGSDTEIKTDYVTVNAAPVAPVANFTADSRTGTAPLTVTFTDTSTGSITSRVWDYRNGTVDWTQFATSTNPFFEFPAGIYDIRLNVTGPGGSDTQTETAYITVT